MKTLFGFFIGCSLLAICCGCAAYVDDYPYDYYPGYPSYYYYSSPRYYGPPFQFQYYDYDRHRHFRHEHHR